MGAANGRAESFFVVIVIAVTRFLRLVGPNLRLFFFSLTGWVTGDKHFALAGGGRGQESVGLFATVFDDSGGDSVNGHALAEDGISGRTVLA